MDMMKGGHCVAGASEGLSLPGKLPDDDPWQLTGQKRFHYPFGFRENMKKDIHCREQGDGGDEEEEQQHGGGTGEDEGRVSVA